MNEELQRSLSRGHLIDITTTGRKTGKPRRIEIVFHNIDGRLIISGSPVADSEAGMAGQSRGRPAPHVPPQARRRPGRTCRRRRGSSPTRLSVGRSPSGSSQNAWRNQDVDAMVAYAPMIEVTIADLAA